MRSLIWNFIAVASVIGVAIGFEGGFMAPRDAFFIAFTVVTVYAAGQLLAHENQPLGEALVSIFGKPTSHLSSVNYLSGLVVGGLGSLIVAHSLTFI